MLCLFVRVLHLDVHVQLDCWQVYAERRADDDDANGWTGVHFFVPSYTSLCLLNILVKHKRRIELTNAQTELHLIIIKLFLLDWLQVIPFLLPFAYVPVQWVALTHTHRRIKWNKNKTNQKYRYIFLTFDSFSFHVFSLVCFFCFSAFLYHVISIKMHNIKVLP